MEKKVLSPHNGKKQNYALKSFLWGMAVIAAFVIPCIIMDKGMYLYFGDYNCQELPFYELMSYCIKNGDTGWNWYTDLGSPFIGSYSVVNLGSPFFLVMLPFPVDWIPYLAGPLTILKFGVASLGAYIYLKRYVKDKNNAVIGAVLYAYSGFAIYNLVFQFEDSIAFFPFLLAALDAFVIDKKRGWFAFMVALNSLVNYYIFVAEAVFLVVYWLVRIIAKNFKYDSAREIIFLGFEAVLGVGMSLFLFLPSIYLIVGNTRVTDSLWTGWNFWLYQNVFAYAQLIAGVFLPPEISNQNIYTMSYDTTWGSITAFMPLFGMTGVFAVMFNKRTDKWLKLFFGACALIMFIPIVNSVFQMFTEAKYIRWVFMANLVMSLASVTALEDKAANWKRAIRVNFILTSIIVLILGFTPAVVLADYDKTKRVWGVVGDKKLFWIYSAVALFNIVLTVIFVYLYKKDKTNFRRYSTVIVSVAVIVTLASSFAPSKKIGFDLSNVYEHGMLNQGDKINIPDIQQWRSDTLTSATYCIYAFDEDEAKKESSDIPTLKELSEQKLTEILTTEENTLYYDDENLTVFWRIPGFECFHSTVNGSIMTFFKGLGYSRTSLSNWSTGMYGMRSLFSVKYLFNQEDDALNFETENGECLMPGWKYIDTQNGYKVYENEYCIPMGLTFDKFIWDVELDKIPPDYAHLVLLDALVVHDTEELFECASMGMTQITAADCDFSREAYYKHCRERQSSACYDFKRDKKGFDAKIKTGDLEEYVLFTVPYDEGWSVKVNGEPAEIKILDFGFMAVKVPANMESTIRFNYHTPGLIYGFFVGGVCLFMLLIYLAAMKVQANNQKQTESEKKQKDQENTEKSDKPEDDNTSDEGSKETADEHKSNDKEKSNDTDEDEITLFDIVKQTEEQSMMHVYNRVPVVVERGYGSTAWDIYEKKYIDFTSGIGVNALGYSDPQWSKAVEEQTFKLTHMSNLYYNTTQIQLAELLCMKTGFSKVFFANSGAEANECAIKLARKYGNDKLGAGKTHIVTLENSFHGRTITTLSATGQDNFHKDFDPFTEGFDYAKANDMESVKSKVRDDTCAVMIELVQGEGGVNPLDKEFVIELSKFCKEKKILLIVDEIQTGMGRTGKLFCYENFGITPDIITSAKALGGGLPLSACLCGEELADIMTAGTNGTTFGGNPIACAGAMVILETVSDEEFLAEVTEKGEYIRERVSQMDGVSEVRGMGMMIGIVLEDNNAKDVMLKCAENGLLVLTAKNLIRLLPPLNIDEYDLNDGLDILEKSIKKTRVQNSDK